MLLQPATEHAGQHHAERHETGADRVMSCLMLSARDVDHVKHVGRETEAVAELLDGEGGPDGVNVGRLRQRQHNEDKVGHVHGDDHRPKQPLEPEARDDDTAEEPAFRGQMGTVNFTVLQVSLFFSIYVFFQVWNQISCRSLSPEVSGFHRILQNPTFLAIGGTVAIGQVLIVTFGGRVFNVESIGLIPWLIVIAFTSTVLIFAEAARMIRLAARR